LYTISHYSGGIPFLLAPNTKRKPILVSQQRNSLLPAPNNLRGRLMLADDPPAATVLISLGIPAGLGAQRAGQNLPSVDNARDPTEDGEADVDEEVGVAFSLL